MTTIWTIACIKTDEFTDRDKGFVTGVGFLLLFSTSIFLGQGDRKIAQFVLITALTFATFFVGSYLVGLLIGLTTNSMILYSIVNSIFVSSAMTFFLNKIIGIDFKMQTVLLTTLCLLTGYLIIDKSSEHLYLYYHIHPRMTMFNIFQVSLIVPLTLGMTIKKPSHDICIANSGGEHWSNQQ